MKSLIRFSAERVVQFEFFWLAVAFPFLLFPNASAPWFFTLLLLPRVGQLVLTRRFTKHTPLNRPIVVIFIMTIIGYLISVDPSMSWAKLWGIGLQCAIFFVCLNGIQQAHHLTVAVGVLITSSIALAAFSLLGTDWEVVRLLQVPAIYDRIPQLLSGLPGSGLPTSSIYFHPREVGATMAMLLPLCLVYGFWGSRRNLKILSIIAFLLSGLVLLLSQALAGIFGLMLGVWLITFWRRPRLISVISITILALGLLFLNIPPYRNQILESLLDINHPLGIGFLLRFDMWSRAVAMIHDMPWTGIGLNTFPLIQSNFYPGYIIGPEVHAHNLVLQTALDLGIPGLLAFIWLLGTLGIYSIQTYRGIENEEGQIILVGLAASVLAFLGNGLFDVMTLGAKPVFVLWIMFALIAAIGQTTSSQPVHTNSWWVKIGLVVAVLGLAMFVAFTPQSLWRNYGLILAHKTLYHGRSANNFSEEQAVTSIVYLQHSLDKDPDQPHLYAVQGSLYIWLGNYPLAFKQLKHRVIMDGSNALAKYVPYIYWQQRLGISELPNELSTVLLYSNWMHRFPMRAEPYIYMAVARSCFNENRLAADDLLENGIEQGAKPDSFLHWVREQPDTLCQ